MPTNKNFGYTFVVLFGVLQLYLFFSNFYFSFFLFGFTLLLLFITFFFSKYLIYPNRMWYLFGLLFGRVMTPLILSIIFLCFFVPASFFMQVISRDVLNLKFNRKKSSSYWVPKKTVNSTFEDQY